MMSHHSAMTIIPLNRAIGPVIARTAPCGPLEAKTRTELSGRYATGGGLLYFADPYPILPFFRSPRKHTDRGQVARCGYGIPIKALYCGLVGGDLMIGFDGNRASAGPFRLELRAARSRLATDQSFGLPLMRRFKADV